MSLTLKVVTPNGEREAVTCDSVHLSVQDNGQGKGGGRYGIRSGHVQALLSVAADTPPLFSAVKKPEPNTLKPNNKKVGAYS